MSYKTILPGKMIGIIGGGQLGRMMAIAAKEMGYKIAVLDPKKNSPCGQVADVEIVASYDDLDAAKQLAEQCDVITYEFENVDHTVLTWLEENAHLPQGSELIAITQDRGNEKRVITESGAKVAPYELVESSQELQQGIEKLGLPCVLKTCRGGYDGKGQVVIREKGDMTEAISLLSHGQCILEKWVAFKQEISVIVSRSVSGEVTTFPVAENIHVYNILSKSIVPARSPLSVQEAAKKAAIAIAKSINMYGTLAVEMFVTENDDIFINELAPRPHNSGHYTMNACETSQFEQHIRAICNWPLGNTNLLKPVVMVNILGEHLESVINHLPELKDYKLHLYGKDEAKVKRKMGHLNLLAVDTQLALDKINQLNIWK